MKAIDPVELEIFRNLLTSVPEEMGVALGRSAYSANIKERKDFSCALFDGDGKIIAQAAHIPVHLGAMPLSVATAIERQQMQRGDVVILNDPFLGGTHLPDLTLVSPVYLRGKRPFAYLASRAHHADVGGISPGSMPLATETFQEGLALPPVKLVRDGKLNDDLLEIICRNSRTPQERRGDLSAQFACHTLGEQRLREIVQRYGATVTQRYMSALLEYSRRRALEALREIPDGRYSFTDYLDDDGLGSGPLPIKVNITARRGRLRVDFTGSAPEQAGSINAMYAVTQSAVWYVIRCLVGDEVPANAGCFDSVTVIAPEGSLLNARFPRAVAGGNVETSQRVVDVVLGALNRALPDRIPAASHGSMNNLSIGGIDHARGRPFAYYETIGGGAGAGPGHPGLSGIHAHMTNTLNTPVEALEMALPLRVRRYSLRRGSGGTGQWSGGDGLLREIELLSPATVTILSDRRERAPYGIAGGSPGDRGRNALTRRGGSVERLPGKTSLQVEAGDTIRIETPGGGGWGKRRKRARK